MGKYSTIDDVLLGCKVTKVGEVYQATLDVCPGLKAEGIAELAAVDALKEKVVDMLSGSYKNDSTRA